MMTFSSSSSYIANDDNESLFHHLLQQIVIGTDDVKNSNANNTKTAIYNSSKEKSHRLHDPATVAQCKEALIARNKSEKWVHLILQRFYC